MRNLFVFLDRPRAVDLGVRGAKKGDVSVEGKSEWLFRGIFRAKKWAFRAKGRAFRAKNGHLGQKMST